MSESPNEIFIKFLESFRGITYKNHNCFDSITEISRKGSGNREPLINCKKEMYSLDDIKDQSIILKENPPKTTDALWYRESENGELSLYLIEFKFHNLDDPDPKHKLENFVDKIFDRKQYKCIGEEDRSDLYKIKKYYGDSVNHSLIMKPIESLNVVIPKLYEEYCNENPDVEKIDIIDYLNAIEKRYFVFVSTYTQEGKSNPDHERAECRATHLEKFLDRLIDGNIIDYYEIWPRCDFEDFLEIEQLVEVEEH